MSGVLIRPAILRQGCAMDFEGSHTLLYSNNRTVALEFWDNLLNFVTGTKKSNLLMIQYLLVEDEHFAAEEIRRMIQKLRPEPTFVGLHYGV